MFCVRFKGVVSRAVAATAALAIAFTAPVALAETDESEAIRMTLSEAVRRALENNLELAIARVDPMSAREDLTVSESQFDSQLTAAATNNEQIEEPSSDFSPQSTTNRNLSVGWSDPNRRGGTFSTNFEHGEVNQNFRPGAVSRFMLIEETFATSVNFAYSQSLLRNLGLEVNTASIEQAKNTLRQSEAQFEDQMLQTMLDVENAYWDLLGAREQHEASIESLNLAKDFLEQTKIKVEVGTLPPIEITTAEAEVASREEDVIVAENGVRTAEDSLRALMRVPETSEEWFVPIVPTDVPRFSPVEVDLEAAIDEAFARRSTIVDAEVAVENARLSERFQRNQIKPDLRADANLRVSGNSFETEFVTGAMTTPLFVDPFGGFLYNQGDPVQFETTDVSENITALGGRSDSFEELGDFDNYDWTLSLNLTVPIGNRRARADHARSRLALEQAELGYESARQAIRVEVRQAARDVDSSARRVTSAIANLDLQRKKVDAEEKRYENGLSTAFEVLSFQNDLRLAESRAINAVIDFNKSIARLARVKGTLLEERNIQIR